MNTLKYVKKYAFITLGCALYAVSVSLFIQPANLVSGGITGISLILNRITGLGTGVLILIFNVPIMLLGIWKFGLRFSISTIYALIVSSVLIDLLSPLGGLTQDRLAAAVCGGILGGTALGIVFRCRATTGGTDIIVKVLRLKWQHVKSGIINMTINVVIVLASGIISKSIDLAIYAVIGVVIQSYVLNALLYGSDSQRMIFIISDKPNEISTELLKKLSIGVTYLTGEGAYTHKNKFVLFSAVHPKTAPAVRAIVRSVDESAFMIVANATEVLGKGFKNINSEDL